MRFTDDIDQHEPTQPLAPRLFQAQRPRLSTGLPTVSAHDASQRVALALEAQLHVATAPVGLSSLPEPTATNIAETEDIHDLKLPAAWYNRQSARPPNERREAMSPERHSMLLRGSAAVCFATAFGLFFWLSQSANTVSTVSHTDPLLTHAASFAAAADPTAPKPRTERIPTSQILAVAERFVATGDVLAARAMLQERAGDSDARAQFALAETYDPHLLASWGARDIEPSVTYARFLYEAARRGGIAEAQLRLDALK